MTLISLSDIASHHPDVLLPPDDEFAAEYAHAVRAGRELASGRSVALVAICRNALPWLPRTLALVEETGSMFRSWRAYIFENDSTDGTKDVLASWADSTQRHASINDNGRPHLNYTTSQERTVALAEYRTQCQWFVKNGEPVDYVIVYDTDAWGGWSVDGVATSIYHMETDRSWYCLASYSWAEIAQAGRRAPIQYDAFACRWNSWVQRDQVWFHNWHPVIGSRPIEFNSAFGQLAVYDYQAYIAGTYSGEDCEHVTFHRSIAARGRHEARLGLNPSSRCVSFWVPNDAGQHGDD